MPAAVNVATNANAALDRSIRRRLLDRVADADVSHPTIDADEGEWQPFLAGIAIKVLREQAGQLSYPLRFEPGAALPPHRHPHDEECVVLDGRLRAPPSFCAAPRPRPANCWAEPCTSPRASPTQPSKPMNASMRETSMTGDEPPPPGLEGPPPGWPVAAEELDEEALAEFARRVAEPKVAASTLLPAASDEQLAQWIDALVERDERALAALYDATFSRMFGIVKRIVRRTALAEEVVEEAYFQVWRQAVRFDPARGHPLTWLLAIARSRAIDAVRHEARFQHDRVDDDSESHVAGDTLPSDELLDLARHQADLHQALMLLGPQPRQLVSLAFFRGLSHEEIAQQMCVPLGTVKSQIRRALLTLRQALGEGGPAALAS